MSEVFAGLRAAVPFVATLGLEEVDVDAERAVLRLPDVEGQRNHVGGPHAGAMFTLGESASGAVVLTHFASTLDRAVPLAVSATIRYLKLAMGPITASAVLVGGPGTVEKAFTSLDAGERPEFVVDVTLTDGQGAVTAEMSVLWTLRPTRPTG